MRYLRSFFQGTVFLCFLAGLLWSQEAPVAPNNAAPAGARSSAAASPANSSPTHILRVAPGDLLEIKLLEVPELDRQVRVDEAGEISMPLLGAVHVAGLAAPEVEALLEKNLQEGNLLRNPNVSVLVKEYTIQGITVLGEVNKPGIYPLLGARRLFDALSAAGGTTAKAGRVVSITRRDQPQQSLIVQLSPDPGKSVESNVEILPGDTVYVSKAGLVYVVGDVVRPGGYAMDNNDALSVLQALALAEGPKRTAKLDGAKLIRKQPEGRLELPVPLKKILAGKAADVSLQSDDILFVPASAGKNAAIRTLEAIVQIATGAAVYSTIR